MSTTTMQPTATLNPASRFFWNHADWCDLLDQEPAKGRTGNALDLACAEAVYLAAEHLAGFTFRVRPNRKGSRPRTWTMWIAQEDGQPVAWLKDVTDSSEVNCRVVRAELALDAMETIQAALTETEPAAA